MFLWIFINIYKFFFFLNWTIKISQIYIWRWPCFRNEIYSRIKKKHSLSVKFSQQALLGDKNLFERCIEIQNKKYGYAGVEKPEDKPWK